MFNTKVHVTILLAITVLSLALVLLTPAPQWLGMLLVMLSLSGLITLYKARSNLDSSSADDEIAVEGSERLLRMEERTRLANELHDSLAQTLASLRFRVRMLDETLHQGDESATWQELEHVESNLDDAHTELRELISRFRAPIDRRGLVPAIETMVQQLRHETDIKAYFQSDLNQENIKDDVRTEVQRIIQEALANIRKHSNANIVQIWARQDEDGLIRILVQDDGVGFVPANGPEFGGEHIGLTVMQERAQKINATFKIESELDEGSSVMLTFDAQGVKMPSKKKRFRRRKPNE